MVDSLKFHRPVNANIGKYEIICSLSHSSLIPPSPVRSILMRAQEKYEFFFFNTTKNLLQRQLRRQLKRHCLLFKWITFIPTQSFQKFWEDIPEIENSKSKFTINTTGKFLLCFQVVHKMNIGVLVAIGVVIAKAP